MSVRPSYDGYDPVQFSYRESQDGDPTEALPLSNISSDHPRTPLMYPPQPNVGPSTSQTSLSNPRRVHIQQQEGGNAHGYDAERAQPSTGSDPASGLPRPGMPAHSGSSNWDVLSGIKKFEQGYEEFDTRHASQAHLTFAEGDIPNNKVLSI